MWKDLLAPLDLDHVVDDTADGVASRCERPADVEEVVAELAQACARLGRRSRLDNVLELVDLPVERVDEVEIVLRDVVDQAVEHHPGVVVRPARLTHGARVVRMLAGRRLAHAQQDVVRHDDVDLLVEDTVFVRYRHRDEEDPEEVVPVSLQRRPGLVGVAGGREQKLERRLLDLPRQLCPQLVRRRIDQIDPFGHRGPRVVPESAGLTGHAVAHACREEPRPQRQGLTPGVGKA